MLTMIICVQTKIVYVPVVLSSVVCASLGTFISMSDAQGSDDKETFQDLITANKSTFVVLVFAFLLVI